jgi:BA14K-like protein
MRIRNVSLSLALTFGFVLSTVASISAMPLGPAAGGGALMAPLQATSLLIEVRNRRGATDGAGLAGGIIAGNIVASQPRYYSGYPQFYTPAYPASGPYSAGDPAIAYCARRFRTYDPYTMTYRGYDGYRHSCP